MEAQQQTRSCDRNRAKVSKATPGGSRQICVPMTKEQYHAIWDDPARVREYLDPLIADYPEMFPASMAGGYELRGYLPESKNCRVYV